MSLEQRTTGTILLGTLAQYGKEFTCTSQSGGRFHASQTYPRRLPGILIPLARLSNGTWKGSWRPWHGSIPVYGMSYVDFSLIHRHLIYVLTLLRFLSDTRCAQDFRQSLQEHPIQTQSRPALCQWLCEQHNMVNTKLGKPTFPCDMPSLDARWRNNPNCRRPDSNHEPKDTAT